MSNAAGTLRGAAVRSLGWLQHPSSASHSSSAAYSAGAGTMGPAHPSTALAASGAPAEFGKGFVKHMEEVGKLSWHRVSVSEHRSGHPVSKRFTKQCGCPQRSGHGLGVPWAAPSTCDGPAGERPRVYCAAEAEWGTNGGSFCPAS